MPRSDKRAEIVVIYCPKTGKILKHKRVYNRRENDPKKVIGKIYNKSENGYTKADDLKVKKERHST